MSTISAFLGILIQIGTLITMLLVLRNGFHGINHALNSRFDEMKAMSHAAGVSEERERTRPPGPNMF